MRLENNITNKNGSYNDTAKPILQLANNHFTKLFKDLEELDHQLKSLTIKLMIFDGD